jgi:hypothetical protein
MVLARWRTGLNTRPRCAIILEASEAGDGASKAIEGMSECHGATSSQRLIHEQKAKFQSEACSSRSQ